ncbi:hypothetical protein M3686_04740 [Micrococcus luteus]|uniref:hypothetical protein n=1 Tax=Micrococcus luteus TaxID=1270 RepID=UPI00204031B7|nr:hypothetical protein [Micrococcus luteus]MCM3577441.1 hypothetical protein [Micrococcus luteus]
MTARLVIHDGRPLAARGELVELHRPIGVRVRRRGWLRAWTITFVAGQLVTLAAEDMPTQTMTVHADDLETADE